MDGRRKEGGGGGGGGKKKKEKKEKGGISNIIVCHLNIYGSAKFKILFW